MIAAFMVVACALLGIAFCCLRISEWHSQESHYWSEVAWKVRLDPKQDIHYRPILDWAQAERPSKRERMRRWQSPELRMMDAAR